MKSNWDKCSGLTRTAALWLLLLLSCWSLPALADHYPTVGGPVWTNGQFQFKLGGSPETPYAIESSPDMLNWQPVVTNSDPTNSRVIQVAGSQNANFFRARSVVLPVPPVHVGLAARENITFRGIGVITDSYNSADTNLSTGGLYDPTKATTNGNVASVGGIVDIGSRTIAGNLYLGPGATYTGSAANVTGTIYTDFNISFPDVSLPNVIWVDAPTTTNTHFITANGYYTIKDSYPIDIKAGVTATFDVTTLNYNMTSLLIHGGTTNSGTVIFYLNGPTSASLSGNSAVDASNRPENLRYYGLPSLTSINFSGNAQFTGVVYAPEASITINGGGNNSLDASGSFVVGSLDANGHVLFHYDEHLSAP